MHLAFNQATLAHWKHEGVAGFPRLGLRNLIHCSKLVGMSKSGFRHTQFFLSVPNGFESVWQGVSRGS